MSTRNSIRRSMSGAGPHVTPDFYEVVERLEQAVASLGLLLTEHAQMIAQTGAAGLFPDTAADDPGSEEISRLLSLPRGVARLLAILVQQNGEVVPDAKLCVLIGCASQSLKVFASKGREALCDTGFENGICRARGRGYYMKSDEVKRLVQLCDAARRNRGAVR